MCVKDIPYRRWKQEIKIKKRLIYYASIARRCYFTYGKKWIYYIGTDVEFMYKNQTATYKYHITYKKRYKNDKTKLNREWKKRLFQDL